MALDLHMTAQEVDADALHTARTRLSTSVRPVVVHSARGPITLVGGGRACAMPSESGVAPGVYGDLARDGVVAVAGDGTLGVLALSGGSVSTCELDLRRRVVIKAVRRGASRLPTQDGFDRHRAEAQWAMELHRRTGLVPATYASLDCSGSRLVIESEWTPAHTLGEWLLHAERSPEVIVSRITTILNHLEDDLYSRPNPLRKPSADWYPDKIRRRRYLLTNDAEIGEVAHTLFTAGGVVNDRLCRPIKTLAAAFATSGALPGPARPCHGDLIPDDILVDGRGRLVALIDPNPQNTTPLADYGKMIMSLTTAYELAIRDQINVTVDQPPNAHQPLALSVGVGTAWVHVATAHRLAGLELAEWIPRVAWCRSNTKTVSSSWLLALAGLQAIAIAPFHLAHHRRPERALYFLAQGLWILEDAMRQLHQRHASR